MSLTSRIGLFLIVLSVQAGCTTASIDTPSPKPEAAADAPRAADATTGPASAADEDTCRAAVAGTAGVGELAVVSSEAAEGGAVVVVEGVVDAEKSRWECVMSAGKVAGIVPVAVDEES